jgi:glutamate-ammonia-ligase adenylyltransferase
MSSPDDFSALADAIDADRAQALRREFGGGQGARVSVLLGTAFPSLCPSAGWQHQGLAEIASEGWTARRHRDDLWRRLRDAAGDLGDTEGAWRGLRRAVWREKARIALRELLPHSLGGVGIDVSARELAELAEAAFELTLQEAAAHVSARFGQPRRADLRQSTMVMLGLGKLGGRELNPGSDVDVIFVYDTDDGGSELSLHEHWSRVVRRAVQTISSPSDHGLVWRVDLRLRPEGRGGPLVNSVAAAEQYYETWGRLWERAALLKARPAAGDLVLGELLCREVVTPFVYRRQVDPLIATSLAQLLVRSREDLSDCPERDLKLGPGGIREAEFFIQSLQLIWGGREPSLRVTGSLEALARLSFRGLVTDREAREIAAAYDLLRRCEHRIQWSQGVQTHLLPEDSQQRARLAATMGMSSECELERELSRARALVQELFASLAPEAPSPPPRHQLLLRQLDRGAAEFDEAVDEALRHPELADHLLALTRRPDDLLGTHTRERFPELADRVLDSIAQSPDPRQAAQYLRVFFSRLVSPGPYVTLFAQEPRALERFITVLGASVFVGDSVVARPDLVDVFVVGATHVEAPDQVVQAELEAMRRSVAPDADRYERDSEFEGALRRAKRIVTIAVAVADLAGAISTRDSTRTLSELADQSLQQATRYELGDRQQGLAVIAVGKLGGRDVGYGSDLDVLFIYEPAAAPDPEEAGEYYIRRAQGIIRLISEPHAAGGGYELDTRLRPSGSQGLLVTSLRSFARYHHVSLPDEPPEPNAPSVLASGAPWERQALLRARVCAGDRRLGDRAIEVAYTAAYERGSPPVEEMHRMRLRMQRELARERPPRRYDLKTGRGGLLDIEFAAQWLQMAHGADRRVRTTDTAQALEALHAAGYLETADFEILRDGYAFLRRLEQRIHVLRGTGDTIVASDRPGLWQLARRMGLRDTASAAAGEILMTQYRQVTDRVRAAYLKVLGIDEAGAG